jgi:hypothetical protein
MGVSGSEHDVCSVSSRGDWAERFWNVRRRKGPGNSDGNVRLSDGTYVEKKQAFLLYSDTYYLCVHNYTNTDGFNKICICNISVHVTL